ncbi:MAG: tetratricopeptide repeat protein [Acidimicrobiia bacterium]|nr:tetratricopeptide repeat protein [Acidimicrobiia bacterium]
MYQVVWVRVFGNVFGNTIYSASIVVAVFMLGLGAGSYVLGAWADRRYADNPDWPLRAYGLVEIVIAALGLGIALVLPRLGQVSAAVSSYVQEPNGWYALSAASYVLRTAVAVAVLAPITLLMGGTLTLLIRYLVRSDLQAGSWRIAVLYGVNTFGAALGALLTDFTLVPALGLRGTQFVAIGLNVVAGVGALYLGRLKSAPTIARLYLGRLKSAPTIARATIARATTAQHGKRVRSVRLQPDHTTAPGQPPDSFRPVILTALALALAGFAALGMEILWFRHMSILLGGFRAVFSLLLALILIGIGVGALIGGALVSRIGRPAEWFMATQAAFVAAALFGLARADVVPINTAPVGAGAWAELWFNARPMLLEVALPALFMGFSFPLGNAIVQRAEQTVGRRAGVLYFANTIGAVCGSLLTGFVLLPVFGLQQGATILMAAAALAIVPLHLAAGPPASLSGTRPTYAVGAGAVALVALGLWLRLPADHVVTRALGPAPEGERRLRVSDGLTELIAITERDGRGRTLYTNGHAMSSTLPLSQRYMRALAHIPLLAMDGPQTVLVIGFGVGNTTHAATLHPSVRRVELADLSRDILAHAGEFEDANHAVLSDPKVAVYINDGRQHLQMQPPGAYDLVVLEPPPIAYAGVSALYSSEFYGLARSRLKPGGYLSQWLPTYQVPAATTRSMIRSFLDVFPQAVLLSGAEADLVLLGTNAPRVEVGPARLVAALLQAPAVRADLDRIGLSRPHEIVGSFLGSARTLAEATRAAEPVRDDRPLQEYTVRSMLSSGYGVPGEVVDLAGVTEWCPRCVVDGQTDPRVAALPLYLDLLTQAYDASRQQVAETRALWEREGRTILDSDYLGAVVPDTAAVHVMLGLTAAERGALDAAIASFRRALELEPDSARTHWHLGAALASRGVYAEALTHLQRSVQLDPSNADVRNDLAAVERLIQR